jgi:hypothetical protein
MISWLTISVLANPQFLNSKFNHKKNLHLSDKFQAEDISIRLELLVLP